jgi:hypothetical protein
MFFSAMVVLLSLLTIFSSRWIGINLADLSPPVAIEIIGPSPEASVLPIARHPDR